MYTKTTLILTIILLLFVGCKPHTESNTIRVADSLLWVNPDSCLQYISMHRHGITKKNLIQLEVISQHAYLKIHHTLENEDALISIADNVMVHNNYHASGEACYILGTFNVHNGNAMEATIFLKQAEKYLLSTKTPNDALMGMLFFNLGVASEQSRLFDISKNYCETALPYLKKIEQPIYISVCYHLLGKCCTNKDESIAYLDSALFYAQQSNIPSYYKEVEVTKQQITNNNKIDSITLNNMLYLCDSCHFYSYAGQIAEFMINQQDYLTAQEYIEKLSYDTNINIWSREQYNLLTADLLHKQKKVEKAYEKLLQLHKRQTYEIESSAYANTYIISQKYDVAKEQELRLQEQVKKQHAYLWIVVVLMICICIGGYTYYIHKKRKLELQLSNEQKKRLEQELESDRAMLRARISERIEITKELYAWCSHHNETMPDILGPLSPRKAANDLQNWKNFYDEFNLCYNNVLAKLKEKHPTLTETDLQYIALTLLQYDTTEMSFLLGIGKQTIWNRRTNVKRHMGMPDDANLNEWIINDMVKEYEIVEPQRIQPNTKKRRREKEEEKK